MTFGPSLMPRGVRPISAELNRPLSDLAYNSTILGQKHNVGCFSHSTFVTEPNSVIRIRKFQEFWNSSESLESPYKYAIFVHFWEMGQVFHSILGPGIRFCHRNWEIPRIPWFWNYFGIYRLRGNFSIWAVLDKWDINSTQFYALNLNLSSELRNYKRFYRFRNNSRIKESLDFLIPMAESDSRA